MGWADKPLTQRKTSTVQHQDLSRLGLVGFLHLHGFMQHRIKGRILRRDFLDTQCLQSGHKGGLGALQSLHIRGDQRIIRFRADARGLDRQTDIVIDGSERFDREDHAMIAPVQTGGVRALSRILCLGQGALPFVRELCQFRVRISGGYVRFI